MGFDSRLVLAGLVVLGAAACAHSDPRRYALRAPVLRDQDLDDIQLDCKGKDAKKAPCIEEYTSYFAWDAVDNILFRPISWTLIVKSKGEARNVNAFDEVPDSSWFVNRIGVRPMTDEEVFDGYCRAGKMLNPKLPDEAWLIDHGKDNGANPGFRVKSEGVKYMLKTDSIDDGQGERPTAATAIASRFYYAAGWWAPCDAVVYFPRSILKLKPGLTIKANVGVAKKFDEQLLDRILEQTSKRGPLFRAAASRWLPGESLGPFTYDGVRDDDPSDVIPHEHRRDLRGARVIAAWLNHFDSREQNSMVTWMEEGAEEEEARAIAAFDTRKQAPAPDENEKKDAPGDKKKDEKKRTSNRGHTRHWYIDLGDSFGSEWTVEGFSRRHGHAYMLDFPYLFEDFVTFGVPQRPWDRNHRNPEAPIFGFFSERDFDPDVWRGEYPNPAFQNMSEGDAAWATRIIARFTKSHIEAAIRAGDLTSPDHRAFLVRVLLARQRTLMTRYFSKLSPITDVSVERRDGREELCAVDLARKTQTWPTASFRYRAMIARGPNAKPEPREVVTGDEGRLCLPLTSALPDSASSAEDDPSRYVVIRIANGVAEGPLELHLYDRGPSKGHTLVGIERTSK